MRGNNLILFDKVNPMVIPFFNLGGRRWVETTIDVTAPFDITAPTFQVV